MARNKKFDKAAIAVIVLAIAILGFSFFISELSPTGFLVRGKADLTVIVSDASNDHAVRDARVYVKDIENDARASYAGRTDRNGEKTVRVSESTYIIEITKNEYDSSSFSILLLNGDERTVNIVLFPEDYTIFCGDGTTLNTCTEPQPVFCNEKAELEERCELCGCPQGRVCGFNGKCS